MTLPRLVAINAYQKTRPPIHLMIASYLGYSEKTKAAETDNGGLTLFDVAPQATTPFNPGALPRG